jgi:Family of unknown function (DUF6713)
MKDLIFYLGFGTLIGHELDSVINHEWRVIPVIRTLPDEVGMLVFVMAHIPLIAILVALISSKSNKIRTMSRIGLGVFLVLHGVLHVIFINHPDYEFLTVSSSILIYGGSILGIIYLFLEWYEKQSEYLRPE